MDRILDLKRPKTVRSGKESDARTRRTPNPLCAKSTTAAPLQRPCESCAGLLASPNHGNRSRETAAHVERDEFFRVLDLPRTGLVRELLICLKNLPNPGRPDRMTVGDQTAARVHRNFEKALSNFSVRTCGNAVAPLFTSSTPLPDSASPRIS